MENSMTTKIVRTFLFIICTALSLLFIYPILIVFMNSFKGKLYISDMPFQMITSESFVGFSNYVVGINRTGFPQAFGFSLFITVYHKSI